MLYGALLCRAVPCRAELSCAWPGPAASPSIPGTPQDPIHLAFITFTRNERD
jgi:hypothetical protein